MSGAHDTSRQRPKAGTMPRASTLGRAALLGLSFLAFVAFLIFAFSRNYANLAYGSDGVFTFLFAIHAWKWAPVDLGFGPYPFEGMSDVWCCENTFLLPGHLLYASLFGKPAEYTAKYGIAAYTTFAASCSYRSWYSPGRSGCAG
jgi:hypothetical protein